MQDRNVQPGLVEAAIARRRHEKVEAILVMERPGTRLVEALAPFFNPLPSNGTVERDVAGEWCEAERKKLLALSGPQLEARHAQALAVQNARVAKQAADKEASKFYNLATAAANYPYWLKMDYWTFDEAVALLLGKDPRIVNPSAMQREIPTGASRAALSPFVQQYQQLRTLAERSHALSARQLKPVDVVGWAHRVQACEIPAPLLAAVINKLTLAETPTGALKTERVDSVQMATQIIGMTPKRWSTQRLAELDRHRKLNGTAAAAEKFGITTARVRQLLPGPKKLKNAKGSSVFNQ